MEEKRQIDNSIYRMLERVAFDTSIGFHIDLLAALMKLGGSAGQARIVELTKIPSTTLNRHLDDMRALGVLRKSAGEVNAGHGVNTLWMVEDHVKKYWNDAQVSYTLDYISRAHSARLERKQILAQQGNKPKE